MPQQHYIQRSTVTMTRISKWAALVFLALFSTQLSAAPDQTVRISIIIDDMGDQHEAGLRAIKLPGAVTYAFLPHTPYSRSLAEAAYKRGKEVMLHLPMQAMGSNLLGPGGLTLDMSREQFRETLNANLAAIPHVSGINNHMGSLLTRHPGHMQWLMEEMKQLNSLYFIDSRTTHHTVANQLANEHHIPTRQRDVFLDDDPAPSAVMHQFNRLIKKARNNGSAIGIGHPYDSTLKILAKMIPRLNRMDIELVAVSQLLNPPDTVRMAKPQPDPASLPGPLVFNMTTETPGATPHPHPAH